MEIREISLSDGTAAALLALSADWEAEGSCYGYRKNTAADLAGRRCFIALDQNQIVGYLFGMLDRAEKSTSIMPDGTSFFEVEELYVRPAYRSQGIGSALFRCAEAAVEPEAEFLLLSTAAKNFRAILHFYVEEMGMEFWSARLFKPLRRRTEEMT